eukprot:Skav232034  [mRNA]  locus=scaffold2323:134752:140576:+ [translate_table: standard]
MYFDGFPEDRNMVLSHHNNFINNIMLVIHFELTLGSARVEVTIASIGTAQVGFAINLDTARKLRQTLFLRRVLDSPQVNQADYLAGQRRFGNLDAPCPDEIQLEHVLQEREERRSGKNNWMTATARISGDDSMEADAEKLGLHSGQRGRGLKTPLIVAVAELDMDLIDSTPGWDSPRWEDGGASARRPPAASVMVMGGLGNGAGHLLLGG